ncbi:PREDICTED: pre-mRNA-splicing regulator WTAP-like, partial [Dipodomys ordii]|uniref:Pre-mRNA-splicing regulator WTAP n=1 Tax=Dipodomys ordii TaxID=10020 RepID=A0A1S3GWR3_DIPOR
MAFSTINKSNLNVTLIWTCFYTRWKQYEAYVQALEGKYTDLNSNDVTGLRESEEKLKQQQQESARRENILVMRLATKEQEMQECT